MYSLLHFSIWFQHFVVTAVVNHYLFTLSVLAVCSVLWKNILEEKFLAW